MCVCRTCITSGRPLDFKSGRSCDFAGSQLQLAETVSISTGQNADLPQTEALVPLVAVWVNCMAYVMTNGTKVREIVVSDWTMAEQAHKEEKKQRHRTRLLPGVSLHT